MSRICRQAFNACCSLGHAQGQSADNSAMNNPELRRRLVAILAADAVGYSRLMSVDDRGTVQALEWARSEFRSQVGAHGGRVIDTAGDSVLAVFDSAASAVSAAQTLQQRLADGLGDVEPDHRLRFRIGIHSGDVIEQADGTIYGDGVNIASRLQALAEAGGITVSQAIHDAVRGRVEARFTDIGEQRVKNIGRPVHVYRVDPKAGSNPDLEDSAHTSSPTANFFAPFGRARRAVLLSVVSVGLGIGAASYWYTWSAKHGLAPLVTSTAPTRSALSIDVLPFVNLTGDAGLAGLADGLTASVTAALTRIPGASVVKRSTTLPAHGKDSSATFTLTGSLQRSGSQLRVSAQLADAASNELLWTDAYDDEDADPLALQDRIAKRIAESVDRETAMRAVRASQQASSPPTVGALMAQGNAFDHLKITGANCQKVESIYRQVLTLDPSNTKAQELLAEWLAIHVRGFWQELDAKEREQMLVEAHRLATQASATDPGNWHVNAAFGYIAVMRGEWDGAERAWKANVLRLPKATASYDELAEVYLLRGEPQRAIEALNNALTINSKEPHPSTLAQMAAAQLMAGHNAAAIRFALQAEAADPTDDDPTLAMAYALEGDKAKASTAVAAVLGVNPKFRSSLWLQVLPPEVVMRPAYLDHVRRVLRPALRLAGFPQ